MYRPLTKQHLSSRTLRYKPCGVIMGQTGAGKTTLSNKLCGTQHRSGAARGSMTQNLFQNDVNCGSFSFSLIDTPGTDSSTDTFKHAVLLKEGLTATEINTIFLIIKYSNRFDKMVENYFLLLQPVFKYARKTAVMISHMDVAENPESEFIEICEIFAEECPEASNILFYSDKSSELQITQFMYNCMSNTDKEQLTITDEEFHLSFNICQMRNQLKVSFQEYLRMADLIVKDYTALIASAQSESVEEKDEILHMLIVEFRNETEEMYQNFIAKHRGPINELDYYVFAIKMQKENVKICDEFVGKVVELMSYNLFDNKDVRNLIKRCPYCKLIWYKTEGCDGATTCGNRVSVYYDVSAKGLFRYIMGRGNGRRWYEKNTVQKKPVPTEPQGGAASSKTDGKGCGMQLVWGQLPKLEDDLILELFRVRTIDEAVALIRADEFRKARDNFETTIDKRFQS